MSHFDIASLAAEWVAVAVTLIGLSSLILQLSNFQQFFDPFRDYRGSEWLGPWAQPEKSNLLSSMKAKSPTGPRIDGDYIKGICGLHELHVSRKPQGLTGKASWTAILAILHPGAVPNPRTHWKEENIKAEILGISIAKLPDKSWKQRLEDQEIELIKHRDKICSTITRTAFVTCLVLSNSYQLYKYSDASGLRAAYSGYSGTWQVHWPLGGFAEIEFFPLDSHDEDQEKHPLSFPRRVDKCILMLLGILECKPLGKIAFPEPKEEGSSVLELLKRGFIAHGKPTHLFNMMGGNPYEVDYLYRRSLTPDSAATLAADPNVISLTIPTPELDLNRKPLASWPQSRKHSTIYIYPAEEHLLATALDCLPWSPLGWSIHRGMQCLLRAYGERVMARYRKCFAQTLKTAIETYPDVLEAEGWSPSITRGYMGDNSATSVMASGGDSGDSVRIVTAAARLVVSQSGHDEAVLDETTFWRSLVGTKIPGEEVPVDAVLGVDEVVGLTKLFVLEWSNELDHMLYEDLPLFMLVA